MKKFLPLLALFAATIFWVPTQAQQRKTVTPAVTAYPWYFSANSYVYLGAGLGQTVGDSLQVADSIAYFTQVNHVNDVEPVLTWYWNKIGTGNPTVTLTFWWSNDGVNYFQCTQGVAETNYTKNFSPTANTWYSVDFSRDSIRFPGRFLETYFITSNTASTKGKLISQLKVNIK